MSDSRAIPEAVARRRAAALAGHQGDEGAARAALTDDDAAVRATAFGALARARVLTIGDLDRAAVDTDARVRRRAGALAAALGPAAAPTVLRLLEDHDATVVETAAWAAGEIEPAVPEVIAALIAVAGNHPDALAREAAVAALGAVGDEAGLPAILAATEDKPAVRRRAVLALAPFEGAAVDAALARALTDRDWQVRQAAEDLTEPDD
jgi:HEAT repeat protein